MSRFITIVIVLSLLGATSMVTTGQQVDELAVITPENAAQLQEIVVLPHGAHEVLFHPTEPVLFACHWWSGILIYDVVTASQTHLDTGCGMSMNVDGTRLATTMPAETLEGQQGVLWNIEDARNPTRQTEFDTLLDSSIRLVFVPQSNLLMGNSFLKSWLMFFIYDLDSQQQIGTISYGFTSPSSMYVSPKGTYIAELSGGQVWRIEDAIAQYADFQPIDQFPLIAFSIRDLMGYQHGTLVDLAFSNDESQLYVGYLEGIVGYLGVVNLNDLSDMTMVNAHDGFIYNIALSPNEDVLATAGCAVPPDTQGECAQLEIKLWSVETLTLLTTISPAHEQMIFGLTFSPDGRLLVSSSGDYKSYDIIETDNTIRLWGIPTNQ